VASKWITSAAAQSRWSRHGSAERARNGSIHKPVWTETVFDVRMTVSIIGAASAIRVRTSRLPTRRRESPTPTAAATTHPVRATTVATVVETGAPNRLGTSVLPP